jgi:hypothetical protein
MGASRCFWKSKTPPAIECIFNDRCFSLVVRPLSRSPKYHFACASQLKTALSPSTTELWPGSTPRALHPGLADATRQGYLVASAVMCILRTLV